MVKTRKVEQIKYKNYLARALEYAASMNRDFDGQMYSSCVLSAIHCAIAAADALCVYSKGLRHAGEDHREAVYLLTTIDQQGLEVQKNAKRFAEILSAKTDAEYGEELSTRKQAEHAKLAAERFFAFVKSRLPDA